MSSYDCIFCNIEEERIVDQNNACLVIRDLYPVTELHTLLDLYLRRDRQKLR